MIRALVFLLTFPALCVAQTGSAPAARPEVKAGDRWVYQSRNLLAEKPQVPWELAVTFAGKGVIHTVTRSQGGMRETDAIWTSDWNAVSSARSGIFDPSREVFRFPLQAGATWKTAYELRLPKSGEYHARWHWTVKVEGNEEVTVPAGKFRALKVVADGSYRRLDITESGTAREVHWYVPRVKRAVKYSYEVFLIDARRTAWTEEELVYYSVQ